MNTNLSNISDADLLAELTQRGRDRQDEYAAQAAQAKHRAQARAALAQAQQAAQRAEAERAAKQARWDALKLECERRRADERQAIIDGHQAKRRAAWSASLLDGHMPAFSDIATPPDEFNGTSRRDDLAKLVALDFSAYEYIPGLFRGEDKNGVPIPTDKLRASRAVNASRLVGEYDPDGKWQPLYHVEHRRDGSPFRRYVTEQMHHVSDVHQIDGGERVIVAVLVDDEYHVMSCFKRHVNLRSSAGLRLWGAVHPNRNAPAAASVWFYEPHSYIATYNAQDAEDLAWRWAAEARLSHDDLDAHIDIDLVSDRL
jgi:hypothetical protein